MRCIGHAKWEENGITENIIVGTPYKQNFAKRCENRCASTQYPSAYILAGIRLKRPVLTGLPRRLTREVEDSLQTCETTNIREKSKYQSGIHNTFYVKCNT